MFAKEVSEVVQLTRLAALATNYANLNEIHRHCKEKTENMQSLFIIGTLCLVATTTGSLGHDFKGFDDSVMYDIQWELLNDWTSVSVVYDEEFPDVFHAFWLNLFCIYFV